MDIPEPIMTEQGLARWSKSASPVVDVAENQINVALVPTHKSCKNFKKPLID